MFLNTRFSAASPAWLTFIAVTVIASSCGDHKADNVPSLADKMMQFEEIAVPHNAVDGKIDEIEINGFVISDAKFNRTDGEGTRYFLIGGESAEFYCGHGKLFLSDLKLGDSASFNGLMSKGRVSVQETSRLWLFLGGSEKVPYAQNQSCYIFPQDFGAVGGSLIFISKKDGQVLTLNYSKPVADPHSLTPWFARHVSKP